MNLASESQEKSYLWEISKSGQEEIQRTAQEKEQNPSALGVGREQEETTCGLSVSLRRLYTLGAPLYYLLYLVTCNEHFIFRKAQAGQFNKTFSQSMTNNHNEICTREREIYF